LTLRRSARSTKRRFASSIRRLRYEVDVVRKQVAIFGSYKENPYLDPLYIAELESITDPNKRAAWLEGDWDIVAGGALDDVWRKELHILPRFPIPSTWRVDRALDWGSSHPCSIGWFAEANGEEATIEFSDGSIRTFCPPPGTLIQIGEQYRTQKMGSNKGLVESAATVAQHIIDYEVKLMRKVGSKRNLGRDRRTIRLATYAKLTLTRSKRSSPIRAFVGNDPTSRPARARTACN
jgi:hypothetical protein